LEMLDLLIWSTLPKPTLKDRKKLVDMLPTLLPGMEEGMRLMSMDTAEQDRFMEKLSSCHARLVNSEAQPMDKVDKEPGTAMNNNANTHVDPSIFKKTTAPATEQRPQQIGSIVVEEIRVLGQDLPPSLGDDSQNQTERLDINLNLFGGDIVDDFDLPAAASVTESNPEPDIVEDECSELVRNLVPGIWFEFHQEDGTKSMETLAWISSVLGSYLFTNHKGLKTREVSTQELEESLRTGRAILADDLSFLVDSSFNNLLDDMQKKVTG